MGHLLTWGVPLLVSYHFAFSYSSWDSQGKNTEVVCHSLLQWTTFCQTSPPLSVGSCRGYPMSKVRGRSQEDPMPRRGSQGVTPRPRSGAAARRSYPVSEVRGGSPEDLPHARGQGLQPGGATPPPRSSGCTGTGEPRGAIPRLRSEGVAVRRYLSSKVRSSSCALLEQP